MGCDGVCGGDHNSPPRFLLCDVGWMVLSFTKKGKQEGVQKWLSFCIFEFEPCVYADKALNLEESLVRFYLNVIVTLGPICGVQETP